MNLDFDALGRIASEAWAASFVSPAQRERDRWAHVARTVLLAAQMQGLGVSDRPRPSPLSPEERAKREPMPVESLVGARHDPVREIVPEDERPTTPRLEP